MAKISATGYVHTMIDNKQTFPEFALACARMFGALVTLRDEPTDAPIPEEFKVDDYHSAKLEESEKLHAELLAMTQAEREAFGEKERQKKIEGHEKYIHDEAEDYAKCREMLAQVQAWEPPTSDHVGLKSAMIEQLQKSIGDESEFSRNELKIAKEKPAIEIHKEAVASAKWSMEYHAKELSAEKARVASRNDWLKKLRDSLTVKT